MCRCHVPLRNSINSVAHPRLPSADGPILWIAYEKTRMMRSSRESPKVYLGHRVDQLTGYDRSRRSLRYSSRFCTVFIEGIPPGIVRSRSFCKQLKMAACIWSLKLCLVIGARLSPISSLIIFWTATMSQSRGVQAVAEDTPVRGARHFVTF